MTLNKWHDARYSLRAIRRRLDLLAAERGIPAREVSKLLAGIIEERRAGIQGDPDAIEAVLASCRRHEINLDWLFMGNLKGLLSMTEARRLIDAGSLRGQPTF